ncbi:MAG TPA: YggT family protein [Thiobacillaceae bacterium]|nr:YggT family protein [Thiobacillaceae bacterium]
MFTDAAQFLLRTLLELIASAFWLRFYMQWARVPFHNPFAQFIVKVTDFAVRPARRVLPGFLGLDWASLVLFYVAELLAVLGVNWLDGYPFLAAGTGVLPGFLLLALAGAIKLAVYILMGLILIQAVLSWVNPFSPYAPVFYSLARPCLAPFQRIIPAIGGVDITPIAALIAMQLVLIAPVGALERWATALIGMSLRLG